MELLNTGIFFQSVLVIFFIQKIIIGLNFFSETVALSDDFNDKEIQGQQKKQEACILRMRIKRELKIITKWKKKKNSLKGEDEKQNHRR